MVGVGEAVFATLRRVNMLRLDRPKGKALVWHVLKAQWFWLSGATGERERKFFVPYNIDETS